jgi:hypothetical protein
MISLFKCHVYMQFSFDFLHNSVHIRCSLCTTAVIQLKSSYEKASLFSIHKLPQVSYRYFKRKFINVFVSK